MVAKLGVAGGLLQRGFTKWMAPKICIILHCHTFHALVDVSCSARDDVCCSAVVGMAGGEWRTISHRQISSPFISSREWENAHRLGVSILYSPVECSHVSITFIFYKSSCEEEYLQK